MTTLLTQEALLLEQEMVKNIEKIEQSRLGYQKKYQKLKMELMEAETKLIAANLDKVKATEALAKHRERSLKAADPKKELELERFRQAFPKIIEDLK